MSTAYWSQWDREDLDSWQGKDWILDGLDDYDPECDIDDMPEEENSCPCGSQCMDCLGFSCRDFM